MLLAALLSLCSAIYLLLVIGIFSSFVSLLSFEGLFFSLTFVFRLIFFFFLDPFVMVFLYDAIEVITCLLFVWSFFSFSSRWFCFLLVILCPVGIVSACVLLPHYF